MKAAGWAPPSLLTPVWAPIPPRDRENHALEIFEGIVGERMVYGRSLLETAIVEAFVERYRVV